MNGNHRHHNRHSGKTAKWIVTILALALAGLTAVLILPKSGTGGVEASQLRQLG